MEQIKILFIDDDYMFASVLQPVMESAGWKVHYQTSLSGCELAIQSWKPDLVLLDMDIDINENGIDAISIIKMFAPELPIVIISSHIDTKYEVKTYHIGGKDFIKKPIIDNDAFLARIKSHISRFQNTTISLGSLSLNWKKMELYSHSGEVIKLSKKELQLLQLLIANKNQIIVYKLIEKCLWPDKNKPDTSEHIIHNYMSHLKKCLIKGGILIESIKGIGYKLNYQHN